MPSCYLCELLVQVRLDGFVLFFRCFALCPFLQRDEVERTVGGLHAAEHAVAQ